MLEITPQHRMVELEIPNHTDYNGFPGASACGSVQREIFLRVIPKNSFRKSMPSCSV
ncbi:MAG: hypothetical protein ACLR0U_23330 [Enterocloster clostridioformis]